MTSNSSSTKATSSAGLTPAIDIILAGSGTSAGIAAIALSQAGFNVAYHMREYKDDPDQDDWSSVVALSKAAVNMLTRLGIINDSSKSQPLERMKLDQRYAQSVSGKLEFTDPNGLARVFSNTQLYKAVHDQLLKTKLTSLAAPIQSYENFEATLTDGSKVKARLCVDGSGRHSTLRKAAGINCKTDDYQQDAIVTWVEHAKSHQDQALQFFTSTGPLALLPLPDASVSSADTARTRSARTRSALVWSQDRPRAKALLSVSPEMFIEVLSEEIGDCRGAIHTIGPRLSQPLQYLLADSFIAPGLVLIGDSAHIVHPLAGQGLNLTLRDIAQLVDCLCDAKRLGLDWTSEIVLEPHSIERRADASLTLALTHQLQSLFKPKNKLSQMIRSSAMHAANYAISRSERLGKSVLGQADQGIGLTPKLMQDLAE